MSQDDCELISVCHGIQHPREHEHLPILEKAKAALNRSHVLLKPTKTVFIRLPVTYWQDKGIDLGLFHHMDTPGPF